jgi:hypothetical protein
VNKKPISSLFSKKNISHAFSVVFLFNLACIFLFSIEVSAQRTSRPGRPTLNGMPLPDWDGSRSATARPVTVGVSTNQQDVNFRQFGYSVPGVCENAPEDVSAESVGRIGAHIRECRDQMTRNTSGIYPNRDSAVRLSHFSAVVNDGCSPASRSGVTELQNWSRQLNDNIRGNFVAASADVLFQRLASLSHANLNCRINALDTAIENGNVAELARRIFINIGGDLADALGVQSRFRGRSRIDCESCYNTPSGTNALIQQYLATFPYGHEPAVAAAIISMARSGSFDANVFNRAIAETRASYYNLGTYYYTRSRATPTGAEYCADAQFKEFAVRSGAVDQMFADMRARGVTYSNGGQMTTGWAEMQCYMRDRWAGQEDRRDAAINTFLMVGGVATAAVFALPTGGASVAAAVSGLAISSVGVVQGVQNVHEECNKNEFYVNASRECNPTEQYEKMVNVRSNEACAAAIGGAVLEAAFAGIDVAGVLRGARAATRALTAGGEGAETIADTARRADVRPDGRARRSGTERRRSGTRSDELDAEVSTAGTAGRAGRAEVRTAGRGADVAGSGGSSVRRRTPARERYTHVSTNTRAKRITDDNFDNPNVRLNEADERALANESYARKREIDQIIGGRPGRDIHEEHAELNAWLEGAANRVGGIEGYIRARGFTGREAQDLREAVSILQRERTVLTRSRVNNDLARLEREGVADVRTVQCTTVNELNANPAFHPSARCSVVKFRNAVENYCACGARGSLGAWAGPCAEAFEDMLTPAELADRDALPISSARNLAECRRIRIPAGATVVHGGLNPTMSGHGGAAQLFIPSRGLPATRYPGAPDNIASTAATRSRLGISDADINVTRADQFEIIGVAPVHANREVAEITYRGQVCRRSEAGCTTDEIDRLEQDLRRFADSNPTEVDSTQYEQFLEWTEWLRGCRTIAPTYGGSTFSPINASLPGCRPRLRLNKGQVDPAPPSARP